MAEDEGCGIYLLTPPKIEDLMAFGEKLDAVLASGMVDCVQLRLKDAVDADVIAAGKHLLAVCHKHEVPLLVNDSAAIAAEIDADGVHLGQDDGDVATARTLLGADKDIGVTCHDSKHLAFEAGEAGANYVAFGAFFESATKPGVSPAELSVLRDWAEITDIPCVAIGGITAENCKTVVDAGAHFVAVCSGIWEHPKGPVEAVQELRKALDA
jgi:thiamine-phosphate pyrophosphorylase